MDKDMRAMRPDAVLKEGEIVRLITPEIAARLYTPIGDNISFPEENPYALKIPVNTLCMYGGRLVRIHKVVKVCGHFHYFVQIAESGEVLNIQFCPAAFVVCGEDESAEIDELTPPDPESMWYFLGVTDSVSLRGKI